MAQRPKQPTTPHTPSTTNASLGRRAALEAATAVGVIGAVASTGVTRALADRGRAGNAAPEGGASPEAVRERALRAHDLRALDGDALVALRRCEAAGVRLVEAYAPRHGGLPFVVEILAGHGHADAGTRRAFELLRRDTEGDAPLASVGGLALVMENRGDGRTPTSEDDARLALRLASALAPDVARLEALALLTPRERRRRAPFATLHVPLD